MDACVYGCGRLTKFGGVIGWESSLGGLGLTVGTPSWKIVDFKHQFGFSRICFSLMCFPQQNTCKSNDEPMKTRFVPKIHKNRSTAGNRNYKDWGGPPNQFSHRRARNLLLSIIACPCAKYTNPTPPGWGRGISGGRAAGFQLVELGGALAGVLDHSAGK